MDTAQWPQVGINGVVRTGAAENSKPVEKKPRPQKEQALNCPRCNSTNTKFCYYNNYSLSQPRYFCKTCRRYWTEGGSLRNVPVGGGSRKNKRSSSSASSSSTSSKKSIQDLGPQNFSPQINPNKIVQDGHDLNLAYNTSHYNGMSEFVAVPFGLHPKSFESIPSSSHDHQLPVMELFRAGGSVSSGGLSSLISMPVTDSNTVYSASAGFSAGDFKPGLGFSVDGIEGYGDVQGVPRGDHQTNSSRILFPFEELKPVSNGDHQFEQDRGHGGTNGYWNGMIAGGSW